MIAKIRGVELHAAAGRGSRCSLPAAERGVRRTWKIVPPRLRGEMDRRVFFATLGIGLLVAPLGTHAQPPPRVRRIGYLESGSAAPGTAHVEAFRKGLREPRLG